MWLTNADVHQCTRFVFDVEFIGDITQDPLACKIWEIIVQMSPIFHKRMVMAMALVTRVMSVLTPLAVLIPIMIAFAII